MSLFLTVLHIMVCLVLIVVVLLQRGKGAEIGAVFGGGASTTVFGSRGAGNFLTKLTAASAIIFMITSLSLAYLANTGASRSIFQEESAPSEPPGEAPGLPLGELAPPAEAPAGGGLPLEAPAEGGGPPAGGESAP